MLKSATFRAFAQLRDEFAEKTGGMKNLTIAPACKDVQGTGIYWYVAPDCPEFFRWLQPNGQRHEYFSKWVGCIGMTPVPACCGSLVIHGVHTGLVHPEGKLLQSGFRRGIGTLLFKMGLLMARYDMYTDVQAITNDLMPGADKILGRLGFKETYTVKSMRTSRLLKHWVANSYDATKDYTSDSHSWIDATAKGGYLENAEKHIDHSAKLAY